MPRDTGTPYCWTGPYYIRIESELVDSMLSVVAYGYIQLFDDCEICEFIMTDRTDGKFTYPKSIRAMFTRKGNFYEWNKEKFADMSNNRHQLKIAKLILAMDKFNDRHAYETIAVKDALEAHGGIPTYLAYGLVKELEKFVAKHDEQA